MTKITDAKDQKISRNWLVLSLALVLSVVAFAFCNVTMVNSSQYELNRIISAVLLVFSSFVIVLQRTSQGCSKTLGILILGGNILLLALLFL